MASASTVEVVVKVRVEPADETSNRFFQLLDQLPTVLKAINPTDWQRYAGGVAATTTTPPGNYEAFQVGE